LIKQSVRRPFTVYVLIIAIFAFGYGGLKNMTPDLLPSMDFPYVLMITTYPGAAPEKVEEEVTKPLERSLSTLEGLSNMYSVSNENVSIVQMEFEDDVNLEALTVDILENSRQASGSFDDMVSEPMIMKLNMDMMPIMMAAIDYEGLSTADISRLMNEELQPKLEGITGVANINVSGLVEEQVNVVVRQDKIDTLNTQVSAAIKGEFFDAEGKLKDTENELKDGLSTLTTKNEELLAGADELAKAAGTGSAALTSGYGAFLQAKIGVQSQITDLNQSLATLRELRETTKESMGGTLPPDVEAQFAASEEELVGAIAMLEAQLAIIEAQEPKLSEAQAGAETQILSGQFGLSYAAAQLSSTQVQLNTALSKVQEGIAQIESARDQALTSADIKKMLTIDMVNSLLTAQNFSMPAGYVHEGDDDYLVRVGDEVESIEELSSMPLIDLGIDGIATVRLSDVADVFMSDNLDQLYAKLNGNDGVLVSFSKQSTYATATVSKNIKEKFEDLGEEYQGLRFTALMDQGDYINLVIGDIAKNLLLGGLFAIIVLFLFLRDFRPTLITLLSIPISVIFAIVLMYFSGVSINIISLSGLAIAVGMLVDNSIVVIENIFRLRSLGYSAVKAAVSGAGQVAAAITSSTLTTICVFAPIVFVTGITRQLFTDFALTLAYSLLASLVIALTLVPAMAGGLFAGMKPKQGKGTRKALALYDRALMWTLRRRALVLVLSVVLLVVGAVAVMSKGYSFMPSMDQPQLMGRVSMPEGSDFAQLKATSDEVSARVMEIEGVETVGIIAGDDALSGMVGVGGLGGGDAEATASNFYVIIDENMSGEAISGEILKSTEDIDAEVTIESAMMMDASALGGSGIEVDLYGDNLDDLVVATETVTAALEGLDGVDEVEGGLEEADSEVRFIVNKELAVEKGLTVAQVYAQVADALVTEKNSITVNFDGKSFVVKTVKNSEETLTPEYIKNLQFDVTGKDGKTESVKLTDVATVHDTKAFTGIERYNQKRYITVTALTTESETVTKVADRIKSSLDQTDLPEGITLEISGESTTIEDAFTELGWMMVIGLLLVYLVMVAQFQSLKNPFIILFTIPLAFTGGLFALLITGMDLSVISLVGFVMLVGVIVNNGIVLIDYINQLRHEGKSKLEAIREGGATRMRPIMMTAATTVLGLIVTAMGIGSGAEMMQPIAVVSIGGLIYGTLMTLFVIPIIYDLFNRKEIKKIDEDELVIDYDI
jgi:HAE1 family hydrophobic/amphiphilic exporter-1